jgi:lipoprotein signal peptidase
MGMKTAGRIAVVIATVATIGCDRVTKHAAITMLAGAPGQSYLADTVRISYVENSGGFLSLGASWPSVVRTLFFTVGTGVVLLALAVLGPCRQQGGVRFACHGADQIGQGRLVRTGRPQQLQRIRLGDAHLAPPT